MQSSIALGLLQFCFRYYSLISVAYSYAELLEYFHSIITEEPFVFFYHLGGSPPSKKGFTMMQRNHTSVEMKMF